jgi:hypothetical protein
LDAYGSDGQDAHVVIFNASYGPYCGGIIALASVTGSRAPVYFGFGDTLGIYYRSIPASGGVWLWKTLRVSLAYPLLLMTILPFIWLYRYQRAKPRSRGFPVDDQSATV